MRLRGPLCLPAVGPPCLTRQQLSGAANTPLASPQRSGFMGSQHRHLFVGMQVGSAIRSHMQPLRAVVAAALGTRFVDPRLSAHRDLHASAKKKKLHQKDTCTAILTLVNDVEKRVNVPHYGAFYTRCQPSQQLCRASPCRWQRCLAEPLVLQTRWWRNVQGSLCGRG